MIYGLLAAALMGQCNGYGHAAYSYTPSYNYSYGYNQAYNAPYVQAKLTVVATEPEYGGYGGLLGSDARYALRDKADQEFKTELLAVLKALKEKPAPAPEVQTFQAPQYVPQQQPQYSPAPAYGPSPQSPVQAAPQQPQQYVPQQPQQPQQPLYAPQVPQKALQVPGKGPAYSPAPLPPQVPQPNPQAGDWGTSSPADGQQTLTSILGNRCAACHDSSNPSGGMAFFDDGGNPLPLSIQQLRKIDRAVNAGRMPKNGPLPPGEASALEDAIVFMYQTARR